jgi:ABC-type sugar transport system ATPase subunit
MNLLPAARAGIDGPAQAVAGIRPHDIVLGRGPLDATVDVVEPRGHDALVHLRLDGPGGEAVLAVTVGDPPPPGARVQVGWASDRLHLFDPTGRRMGREVT